MSNQQRCGGKPNAPWCRKTAAHPQHRLDTDECEPCTGCEDCREMPTIKTHHSVPPECKLGPSVLDVSLVAAALYAKGGYTTWPNVVEDALNLLEEAARQREQKR